MSSEVVSEGPTTGGGGTVLLPSVTRLSDVVAAAAAGLQLAPVTIVLAAFVVFFLALFTVGGNSFILAAFYRYKRLRTASNCLLVSLAISDFGVGVVMPFGTYLELADGSGGPSSGLCVVPYCVLITLCSVSVLVTVAIAVDRLTSLAQPLRYKNIITHSSIEKYIAVFWAYATVVGLSPLMYPKVAGADAQAYSGSCRFNGVIKPPVRVFLFLAVWAPSALILIGCYVYVYLVARAHARAIYTVELSFRNQTQTLALPRYGQTLAVTVGAFFILWLPFQTCMLLDTFFGTNILSECTVWLGLPILAHSGTNPWIYAFHHGEIRLAAGKVAEDLVSLFGVTPSHYYGCSPTRRGSHTNLELAEVNSNEERRPAVEDCFAAKHLHHQLLLQRGTIYSSKRGLELSTHSCRLPDNDRPTPDRPNADRTVALDEDIHELTKMLEPRLVADPSHSVDNANTSRIRNLKYLLDPTFLRIRHLGRLNCHKRVPPATNKARGTSRFHVSYQHLEMGGRSNKRRATVYLNAMSDPALNADNDEDDEDDEEDGVYGHRCQSLQEYLRGTSHKPSNLSSVSDSNISCGARAAETTRKHPCLVERGHHHHYRPSHLAELHRARSVRWSFSWARRARQRYLGPIKCRDLLPARSTPSPLELCPPSSPRLTITPNRLASLVHRQRDCVPSASLLEPSSGLMDCRLQVPAIRSEPPSPIESLQRNLDSLQEEDGNNNNNNNAAGRRWLGSPTRHSDPVVPSVLLNIEDDGWSSIHNSSSPTVPTSPKELSELLLMRLAGVEPAVVQPSPNIGYERAFREHDCATRFSSRRPSDSRWSESSRSQEVLSCSATSTEPLPQLARRFPSSCSVSHFDHLSSSSRCLVEPFLCSDAALTSSLRESFFGGAVSMPDSEDTFTCSFDDDDDAASATRHGKQGPTSSASSVSLLVKRPVGVHRGVQLELQSRSTESILRSRGEQTEGVCAILRLDDGLYRSRPRLVVAGGCNSLRLAPLATPTPTDDVLLQCTPTLDVTLVAELKTGEPSPLGVRV
ncbi:uncharacterized protein LOC106639275 [Copidosoma floridanum]|uniref:uncharacterized protein LOC106639275 n=1 Tax=Copidosoma floridanum TaxID=29053 RepID=UPI000C6F9594|nr:uncharacterized protein LOC106639275 [Copidosoma floridanum]